jgi:hypothetical protein
MSDSSASPRLYPVNHNRIAVLEKNRALLPACDSSSPHSAQHLLRWSVTESGARGGGGGGGGFAAAAAFAHSCDAGPVH